MRSQAIACVVILLLLGGTAACVRVNDYIVAAGVPEGWVNIELSNPDCAATPGRWHRQFLVPSSGYACTSTGPTSGWVYERYWLTDESGQRRRLEIGERVHARSVAKLDSPTCHVTVAVFWYGERDKITGDSCALIRARKPECK